MINHAVYIVLVALSIQDGHANKGWSYSGSTGPNSWPSMFSTCDGKSQSPINIETGSVKNEFWQPFSLKNYDQPPTAMRIKNNGHAAQVEIDATTAPRALGGGLKGEYIFAQFHFHWGKDSSLGSEHTIDGVRYPMELHFVHYKAEYGSLGEAVKKSDGLAVLGVMFEISQTDNAALTPLVNGLNDISKAGDVANVPSTYPLRAFLPSDLERFYRYTGSLTTPTCNEVVTWTVFARPAPVSESQMEAFRSLSFKDGNQLVNNFRPPQPLQGRKVSVSASSGGSSALPLGGGGGGGGSSATMKKLGLALYFMSTMAVMVMNI